MPVTLPCMQAPLALAPIDGNAEKPRASKGESPDADSPELRVSGFRVSFGLHSACHDAQAGIPNP